MLQNWFSIDIQTAAINELLKNALFILKFTRIEVFNSTLLNINGIAWD